MQEDRDARYPSAAYGVWIVAVLFLVWTFAYLDRQIMVLLVAPLKADLHLTDTEVSLLQGAAFASVFVLAGLAMGALTDRYNRRTILIFGVTAWSVATVASGLATGFWQLFLARMAVGLGEACLAPVTVSLMADYFPPAQRARAMGFMQAGSPIGSAFSMFGAGMILTVAADGHGLFDVVMTGWAAWNVVLVTVGVPGLIVAGLVATLGEPPRHGALQATAQANPGGTSNSARHVGTYITIFGVFSCIYIIGYGVSNWAPVMMMRLYGSTPAQTGLIYGLVLLTGSPVAGIISGYLNDALVARRPEDGRVLIPAFFMPLLIVSLAALMFVQSLWALVAALWFSLFFASFISTSSFAALQDITPNRLRGMIVALFQLTVNLTGLGIAPTAVALVTDRVFGDEMKVQSSVGIVALSTAFVGLVLALLLPRLYRASRRGRAEEAGIPLVAGAATGAAR